MSKLFNIVISLIIFGLIIFFHEFGHFLFAKLNGIYVNEFAIGMGPTLFSFTRKETKYCIKLLPIGGYCMMLGEDGDAIYENSQKSEADANEGEETVQLTEEEIEHSFSHKSVWKRLSVVVAGPIFNFILAFAVSLIFINIIGYDLPTVTEFTEHSAAKEAGLEIGDVITKYNGSKIYNYREVRIYNMFNTKGEPVELTVDRDGKEIEITIQPKKSNGNYIMGFIGGKYVKAKGFAVIKYSACELRYYVKTTYLSLGHLISGKLSAKNLSGPVGIVSMMSDTIDEAKDSAEGNTKIATINVILNLMNFAIMLSANLGVMNLIPFPALDGGRALLLLIEGIFKKKLPAEKEAWINAAGMLCLLGLIAVVMVKDIVTIFI